MTTDTEFDFGFSGVDTGEDRMGAVHPFAQFVNPKTHNFCGLGCSRTQAESVGFSPTPDWDAVDIPFLTDAGEVSEPFWLCQTPRVLVLNESPLYLFHAEDRRRRVPYSVQQKQEWGDNARTVRYLVIALLDESNNAIVQSPLRLKCGGVAGTSFTSSWFSRKMGRTTGFIADLRDAYAKRTGDTSPKGRLFDAHGVYCPIIKRAMAGKGRNVSPTARTEGYAVPTEDNLQNFLIPHGSDLSRLIQRWRQESADWVNLAVTPDAGSEPQGGGGFFNPVSEFFDAINRAPSMDVLANVWSDCAARFSVDQQHPNYPALSAAYLSRATALQGRAPSPVGDYDDF